MKTREAYELGADIDYNEWSVWDSCDIDGSYPGECKHGMEHFLPASVVKQLEDREATDTN